jgi:multisubunit Na+/H+ antiporter MnhC subunit
MNKNKVALMMFSAAVLSLLVFGAIGDVTDEAYAADPDDDAEEETEYVVEVFDLALASVIVLSAIVLSFYLTKK